MGVPLVLFLVALILALVDQIRERGQSLVTWAVILVCLGLLWGWLGEGYSELRGPF